ncbi:MAG: glycosyltransferase [Longimicrobiales bacterium]
MKVVIQSDSWIWGGNEKWLLLIGEGLRDRGHDVLVSCKPRSEVDARARALGLRVTHRRPGADADLVRTFGFAAMLRREAPDAVLLSAFKRSFWGGWAARRAGVKRIVERMGIERAMPARWKYRYAFRNYIDAMIVNSARIRERWLASAPWYPAHEVHVVLNGVRPSPILTSDLRAQLGIPAGSLVFTGAGRLERRKGFDILIDGFARSSATEAHLVIAGDGDDEAPLRAQARAAGIGNRVHFIGFRTDLDAVLAITDVFVLPSRLEGMANVMLEAMAAGCLIVATDISGVREAIGSAEGRDHAGWIVPPDDAAAMALAITSAARTLLNETDAAEPMRAELRFRVESWFSPERAVAETERILFG